MAPHNPDPFLGALFRPSFADLLQQCAPPAQCVLLVPRALALLSENITEEFLASHIVRCTPLSFNQAKNKVRHYPTLNGRTLVFKDLHVYPNKGFKTKHSAKMLNDILYYPPHSEAPFIVYYIDRPLLDLDVPPPQKLRVTTLPIDTPPTIDSLAHLFTQYPTIGRSMQPGLERLLREFNDRFQTLMHLDDVKAGVDKAVADALELFSKVENRAIRQMANTSDVNEGSISRIIEKFNPIPVDVLTPSYILENTYNLVYFQVMKSDLVSDLDSESMEALSNLDIHQVEIPSVDNFIVQRLLSAIACFRTFGTGRTPSEKMEVLINTVQIIACGDSTPGKLKRQDLSEKAYDMQVSLNADYIISLLVLVMVSARSKVANLESNLLFIRRFSFDDVESGEIGFVVSTLDAVVQYLRENFARLKAISDTNAKFWRAIKSGDVQFLQRTFVHSPPSSALNDDQEIKKEADFTDRTLEPVTDQLDALFRSCDSEGNSAIMMSVSSGMNNSLHFLLNQPYIHKSFHVNDRDYNGITPLMRALELDNIPAAKMIVDHLDSSGLEKYLAATDPTGRTIAHSYYIMKFPELIQRFAAELPWTKKDNTGQTPIFALCRLYDHPQCFQMLSTSIMSIQRHSTFNADQHIDSKANSLFHLCGNLQVLNFLLELPGNINLPNQKGLSPLLHFIKLGKKALVQRLLEDPRIDLNIQDSRGLLPIHTAASTGNVEMLSTVGTFMSVDLRSYGMGLTALHIAVREKAIDCIDYLLNHGADLQAEDRSGARPSEYTNDESIKNHLDVYYLLLNRTPTEDGRVTAVVRPYLSDDLTVQYIIKSGIVKKVEKGSGSSLDVSTLTVSRRSLADFVHLRHLLAFEQTSAWLPTLPSSNLHPCLIPSKPSRAILRELTRSLDDFLSVCLNHPSPTISKHELLWEFFMVGEMQHEDVLERTRKKAELIREEIWESYEPIENTHDAAVFFGYAIDSVDSIYKAYKEANQRARILRTCSKSLSQRLAFSNNQDNVIAQQLLANGLRKFENGNIFQSELLDTMDKLIEETAGQ
ncbi:UPF0507 protein, partial [Neolecta irregularis DAH-3]